MQRSAQKARLCYLKNGLYFWLSSCRHLLQLFQRPKHAPAAIVSTFNTYNNKYYFIRPILHLVSGAANESRALRASAVKPLWSMGNSLESGSTGFTGTVAGWWPGEGREIYLMNKEKQEIIEKMILQRTENIISGAVFGQTCLSICKSKWISKQIHEF